MREGYAVAEGRKRQVVSDELVGSFFATCLWLSFLGTGDWSWSTPGDRQGKCRLRMTGGIIIDQCGLSMPSFRSCPALQISTHGWSDSRNGKLLEECLAGGLRGMCVESASPDP
jgi:hypothetical protein